MVDWLKKGGNWGRIGKELGLLAGKRWKRNSWDPPAWMQNGNCRESRSRIIRFRSLRGLWTVETTIMDFKKHNIENFQVICFKIWCGSLGCNNKGCKDVRETKGVCCATHDSCQLQKAKGFPKKLVGGSV